MDAMEKDDGGCIRETNDGGGRGICSIPTGSCQREIGRGLRMPPDAGEEVDPVRSVFDGGSGSQDKLVHDAATHRDDVPGKISNKQDVACVEMVGPNKTIKIRAREGKDLAPCTDKVGRDWSLVLTLMGIEVDENQCRQTDLRGDREDDRGVIRDLLTAYLMGGGRR